MISHKLLLTVNEAAHVLSLSRRTVYELVNRGDLQLVKIGRASRVPASSIERYVERLERKA